MCRYIFYSLKFAFILILNVTAQTFDLRFNVINSDEINFDVQIQIKSSSEFKIAASNIAFNYNSSAINNPSLLSTQNYSGVGGNPLHIYSDMTVTQPNEGITSLNIIYTQTIDDYASYVTSGWNDVGVIRFTVININNTPNLVFRTSGISPTTIYKISGNILTLLSPGNLVTYNDPLPVELSSLSAEYLNNAITINWTTKTEINNFGFEIERYKQNLLNESSWEEIGFVAGNGNSNSTKDYCYIDINPLIGYKNVYRLKIIDTDGKYTFSDEIEVSMKSEEYSLNQNFPNPFNPTTKISYFLPSDCELKLEVFNTIGQSILVAEKGIQSMGYHEVNINANNFPSGIYFYSLIANSIADNKEFRAIRKMVLLK